MKPVWLILFLASAITLFVGILFDMQMLYLAAEWILVMLIYITAQYLIVQGLLKHDVVR